MFYRPPSLSFQSLRHQSVNQKKRPGERGIYETDTQFLFHMISIIIWQRQKKEKFFSLKMFDLKFDDDAERGREIKGKSVFDRNKCSQQM